MVRNWFGLGGRNRNSRKSTSPSGARSPRRWRPTLEPLEVRTVPAVTVFNSLTGQLTVTGDAANDTIQISSDTSGNIRLNGAVIARLSTTRAISVYAGGGNDFISASGLRGFAGGVRLDGQLGNDTITGSPGNDTIQGGVGNDWLVGGNGHDWMDGWDGDDTLLGGWGNDTLHGGWGNDRVSGNADHDWMRGWEGNDTLYGGAGNDWMDGWHDHDFLYGGTGNDVMHGGSGNDNLYGWGGSDRLYGWAGNDGLFGGVREGSQRDTLDGGGGNDRLLDHENSASYTRGSGDVVIRFRNEDQPWTSREIEEIDKAFVQLQARVYGTTWILTDRLTGDPLTFVKGSTYLGPGRTGRNRWWWRRFDYERRIHLLDWDEFSAVANRGMRSLVIHEIGHNWDGTDAFFAKELPRELYPLWDAFKRLHEQSLKLPRDHREYASPDFARNYGQTNANEDWGTVWEMYFGYISGPPMPSSLLRAKLALVDAFFNQGTSLLG